MSVQAIEYRLRRRRLHRVHRVHRGVYAVGRPELTRLGELAAAVLACGPNAALSHDAAGELLGIRRLRRGPIDVTVAGPARARPGLRVHRRSLPGSDVTHCHGVRVTNVVRTLIDLAQRLTERELEVATNEADRLDLVDPERLRAALERRTGHAGVTPLRALLDGHTSRSPTRSSSGASCRSPGAPAWRRR